MFVVFRFEVYFDVRRSLGIEHLYTKQFLNNVILLLKKHYFTMSAKYLVYGYSVGKVGI